MQVTVDRKAVFKLLDTILPLWKAVPKRYPYNRKEAFIPQRLIPEKLRADKRALACFYFYACIYMRGGIESKQAFNALLRMHEEHPDLFDPLLARFMSVADVQSILKQFIGWDSRAAAYNWVENSRRLAENWGGNPLNLVKGVRSYEEACRRMRNKRTRSDRILAGRDGEGFVGFQYKMVSMFLYFLDWEKLLPIRFPYPSPADFHNFRLGIAAGAIKVILEPGEVAKANEKMSAPWRAAIMAYLRERKADPVEVADAIWLFSLVLCGNSPATLTKADPLRKKLDKNKEEIETLMTHAQVIETWDLRKWALSKTTALKQTCLVCPFMATCRPVPARPYYTKGLLVIRETLGLQIGLDAEHLQIPGFKLSSQEEHQHMFELHPADAS